MSGRSRPFHKRTEAILERALQCIWCDAMRGIEMNGVQQVQQMAEQDMLLGVDDGI